MAYIFTKDTQAFLDALNNLNVQVAHLVSVVGNVSVSNFPATQSVSGSITVNNFPSTQAVTGTFWPATQPVSGSLSTVPIVSNAATLTASATITTVAVKIIGVNANRKGLSFYNNSANSVYLKLGAAGNAGTDMSFILATFAHLSINALFPGLNWTGEVWGIRNAGTGAVIATELT